MKKPRPLERGEEIMYDHDPQTGITVTDGDRRMAFIITDSDAMFRYMRLAQVASREKDISILRGATDEFIEALAYFIAAIRQGKALAQHDLN
jgi:hypothetical protein